MGNLAHTTHIFSNPRNARRHELAEQMLQSYIEGVSSVDSEMQAAKRRGYQPVRRPADIRPQLNDSLSGELERAVDRILEYESQPEGTDKRKSAEAKVARIVAYLQKQAYLTGAASRRTQYGENLVLVVLRSTGTEECARYVGRVFIDDVYSDGELYQSPTAYSTWHAPADRFARRGRYPLLSEAIKGGLYHYGCKCWHVSFFEGATDTNSHGEQIPSFVHYDPGIDSAPDIYAQTDDYDYDYVYADIPAMSWNNALEAVRQYLSRQNIDPARRRSFSARHSELYERNVPQALHQRIMAYLSALLGENFEDTNEAYAIYHALLNLLSTQMLQSMNLDPSSLADEFIHTQLYILFGDRGSGGRSSGGLRFGGTTASDSYEEFRRLYVFLQNFDGVSNVDTAAILEFLRNMDARNDVVSSINFLSTPRNVRSGVLEHTISAGVAAVMELHPNLSQEEARVLYWSYVWATNSNTTYARGSSQLAFSRQFGASVFMGIAAGAFAPGATASDRHTQRPSITSSSSGGAINLPGAWWRTSVTPRTQGSNIPFRNISDLPQNVQAAFLRYDNHGWRGVPPGMQSVRAGKVYDNRDRLLPTVDRRANPITYREFDINRQIPGSGRDAQRFVVGSDGSIFVTYDHYRTFLRIR